MFQTHPLRKGRVSLPLHYYCVTNLSYNRQPIFASLNIAQIIINNIYLFDKKRDVKTICYVLMQDHIHWLFQLQDTLTLSQAVS